MGSFEPVDHRSAHGWPSQRQLPVLSLKRI
jgi:hypothetical protein